MVLPHPPLTDECHNKETTHGRINSHHQPSRVPYQKRDIDKIKAPAWKHSMSKVKWKRREEPNGKRNRDKLVAVGGREHVFRQCTPCNTLCIVRLHTLSRPHGSSLDGFEDRGLVINDGVHHDVVEDAANYSSNDLRHKGRAW